MKKISHITWALLMVLSHLGFSYYYFDGWWYSSIGTGFILLFSYLIWKKDFLKVTGIRMNLKSAVLTISMTVVITTLSLLIVRYIGSKYNIAVQYTGIRNYYHNLFYILNEEILLGGIPVYLLIKKYRIRPLGVSSGLALIFSFVHYMFYRWIFLESGILEFRTLISLFLVGFIRNNLIITSRHIGYSWALHFGWMVVMFGSYPYHIGSGTGLTEPERFNMFLGSNELLLLSIFFAGISLFYMLTKYRYTAD